MDDSRKTAFRCGLRDGIPIALGYLFVSVGFGITAINAGLKVFEAVLISASNLTSAGQVAGLEIIEEASSFAAAAVEMFLAQFVINLRYSLMGISLTQKADESFTFRNRLVCSFSITDEIFAVASTHPGPLSVPYFIGLSILPILGWSTGTLVGATVGASLPPETSSVLGIAIYGMFLSIIVSPAKKDRGILFCVFCAAAISCVIYYIPSLDFITSGFSVIISSVLAAVVSSAFFPRKEEDA